MPKINGRGVASNNRLLGDPMNPFDANGARGKLKGKNGLSLDVGDKDYVGGFANLGSQLINNGQGHMLRQ